MAHSSYPIDAVLTPAPGRRSRSRANLKDREAQWGAVVKLLALTISYKQVRLGNRNIDIKGAGGHHPVIVSFSCDKSIF